MVPHRLAACRSVRFSAIRNTVTNARRPGDQPRGPVTRNAQANSASANNSPNRSRTATGSGACRPESFARTARATSTAGSGHDCGSIDTPTHPRDRDRRKPAAPRSSRTKTGPAHPIKE
jgi:hypothetical protein